MVPAGCLQPPPKFRLQVNSFIGDLEGLIGGSTLQEDQEGRALTAISRKGRKKFQPTPDQPPQVKEHSETLDNGFGGF